MRPLDSLSSRLRLALPLRLARVALTLGILGGLASCGGDQPTAPERPGIAPVDGKPADLTSAQISQVLRIRSEIKALLLKPEERLETLAGFDLVVVAVQFNRFELARRLALAVDQHILSELAKGRIGVLPGSGTPAASAAVLVDDISRFVGLPVQPPPGPNAFVVLVSPSPNEQIFPVTYGGFGDEQAVFIVPGGATQSPALLVIDRNETGATLPPDLLDGLTTLSKLYEVHFSPAISFTNVIFGVCILPAGPSLDGTARMAHQVSATQLDILPLVDRYYICDNDDSGEIGLAAPQSGAGGLRLAARRAAHRAWSLFAPSVAYAGHAAILGSVTTLSPFQVVSTATEVSSVVGVEGSAVSIDASLRKVGPDESFPGQTLTLLVDGEQVATGVTNADGHVLFEFTETVGGTHSYTVRYDGSTDGIWAGSFTTGSFFVYGID